MSSSIRHVSSSICPDMLQLMDRSGDAHRLVPLEKHDPASLISRGKIVACVVKLHS